MKKIITSTTIAATLLVGTPVGLVNAETVQKDTTTNSKHAHHHKHSHHKYSHLYTQLFNYFNLPNLQDTNFGMKTPKTNTVNETTTNNSTTPEKSTPTAQTTNNTKTTTADQTTNAEKTTTANQTTSAEKTTTTNQNTNSSTPTTSTASSTMSAYEQKVFELTNAERAKAGLKPFATNDALNNTARLKSQDMTDKHYFDHTSPTYGSPFDMMKQFGITYNYAAENIAQGQQTPEEVVNAWMNSAGHRANILNPNLNQLGVGYDSRSNTWTQQFIGK